MIDQKQLGYILTGFAILLIVLLIFVKTNYDQNAAVTCELIAEDPSTEMEECPYHQSPTSWLLLVAFGISFIMLGGGIYLSIFYDREEEKKSFKEVDMSKFNEDEAKVYKALRESDGSMYQSDLVKETGLSKVKMTRTLDKLENKDVAERKRRGMTNLVVLK